MTLVREITDIVEGIAGVETFFEGDNIGLLLGNPSAQISAALCCLDVTDSVINQAVELNAHLIISHHPLIFSPISAVREDTASGGRLMRLIRSGINVYSAHTNLDFCPLGINEYAAELAGLTEVAPMSGRFGRVGNIEPLPLGEFVLKVQRAFGCKAQVGGAADTVVRRAAIINGSGGGSVENIDLALELNADCLVSSEFKHHVALYAREKGLALIQIPHFSAEYCYVPRLKELIEAESRKRNLEIKLYAANEINPIN